MNRYFSAFFAQRTSKIFNSDHYSVKQPPGCRFKSFKLKGVLIKQNTLNRGGGGEGVLSTNCSFQPAKIQRAKKVLSDNPGLVDFALALVNFVLRLLYGQVKFFENSSYRRTVESC